MNCKNCGTFFGNYQVDFVCPICQTPNFTGPEIESPTEHHPEPKIVSRSYIKAILVSLGVVIFVAITALFIGNNLGAKRALARAVGDDKLGKYNQAHQALDASPHFLVLPAVRQSISAENSRNVRWLAYYSDQQEARKLIKSGKYNDALKLLNQIPKDYPTFSSIKTDILGLQNTISATTSQKPPNSPKKGDTPATKRSNVPRETPVQTMQPSAQIQDKPQIPTDTGASPYVGSLPDTVPINTSGSFNFYYAGGRQFATANGASAVFTQAQPSVPEQAAAENHSLIELAVLSSDGRQIVEIGWVVDGTMNGDTLPHLFVYHWVDGQTSCYNGCGFVQTSQTVYPGDAITVGNTGSYSIAYASGRWDLSYNGTGIGYFPGSLWSGAFTQFGFVQVFGEVAISQNSSTQCIQMGNSLPGNNASSAKISNFSLTGSNSPVALSPYATISSPYSYGFASATGVNIAGPGSC